MDYVFLYCFLAAFFRTVPFISTMSIGFMAGVQCFFKNECSLPFSIGIFATYCFVDSRLSSDIFEIKLQTISSALLGMSVFLGLYAFGIEGIIYGPLLIAIVQVGHETLNQLSYDESNNLVYESK